MKSEYTYRLAIEKKKKKSQTQSGAVSKATSRCIFSSYRPLNSKHYPPKHSVVLLFLWR